MKISKHFTYKELIHSNTAIRLGIDNDPNEEQLEAAKLVALNCADPIRDHYGVPIKPNSFFRGFELEMVICAKKIREYLEENTDKTVQDYLNRKQHPKGEAIDIEVPGIPNQVLFDWVKENLEYDQLLLEFHKPSDPYSGWVHVSYKAVGNRQQALVIG